MKLLFVTPSVGMGGAERVVAMLANEWALEHSVHILTLTEEADFYTISERIKRHKIFLRYKHWYDLGKAAKSILAMRRVFTGINPDFIISFMLHPNILSLIAGLGMKKKIVICERNIIRDTNINKRQNFLRRFLYPRAYKITVQHDEIYREFLAVYPHISPGKVFITPNPVNKFIYNNNPLDIKKFFPHSNQGDKLILGIGRFTPVKAFKDLISVFNLVHKKYTDARLAILGDGQEYGECNQLIQSLSLDDYVSLPGRIEDMNPWYHSADIFVTTTFFEGFPNALAESLAAGLPAVAFEAPSIPALIKDGVNGYIVKERNQALMAEKICFLLNNPDVYIRMSDNAQKIAVEFSLENINTIWFEQILT
jgi:glycosyltransferase involved in cell wall biosynthesis